jgi:large subunit ribosomal protein L9
MKVILTQDIDKLGNAGSLQEVKPGFARNYLIPNGLAQPATSGMIKQVEERQAAERRRIVKQENAMQSLSDRIQGMRLTFTARAGETGRLFGSVTSADIAEQLSQELGEEIDRRKVDLPGGIHEVGEFPVTLNLVGRLKPQITVIVNAEGVEAVAATETETSAEDAVSDEATEAVDEEPSENEA